MKEILMEKLHFLFYMHNSILFHVNGITLWEVVSCTCRVSAKLNIPKILSLLGFSLRKKKIQKAVIFCLFWDVFPLNCSSECFELSVGVRFVSPTRVELRRAAPFNTTDARPQKSETMSLPHQSKKSLQRKAFVRPPHQSSQPSVTFSFQIFSLPTCVALKGQPSAVTCCFCHNWKKGC